MVGLLCDKAFVYGGIINACFFISEKFASDLGIGSGFVPGPRFSSTTYDCLVMT